MKLFVLFYFFVLSLSAQNSTQSCPAGYLTVDTHKPCEYQQKFRSTAVKWQASPSGWFGAGNFYLENYNKAGIQLGLTALAPISTLLVYCLWPKCLGKSLYVTIMTAILTSLAALSYWAIELTYIQLGFVKDGHGQPLN